MIAQEIVASILYNRLQLDFTCGLDFVTRLSFVALPFFYSIIDLVVRKPDCYSIYTYIRTCSNIYAMNICVFLESRYLYVLCVGIFTSIYVFYQLCKNTSIPSLVKFRRTRGHCFLRSKHYLFIFNFFLE